MKYPSRFAAFGLLASLVITAPAAAQLPRSAVYKPGKDVMTPDDRRRNTHNKFQTEFDMRRLADPTGARDIHLAADAIAACIVERGGGLAPSYLGGSLVGDANFDRISKVLNGKLRRCAQMSDAPATATAISGSLAEQLVEAKIPTFADRAPSVNEDDARKFYGDLSGSVTFDTIAGCLVVYSPGLSYKLMGTEAGSSDETAALTALFGQTPECGMASPPSSIIPPIYQRAALATALYKWTASS